MVESPFKLKIGLSVLNLLGPNLYSNIAAVLSEMVANAWDASASVVTIDINPAKDEIKISDDGLGMSLEDINEKYLNIGYLKRKQTASSFTKNGRHVMGRKGIGKLAAFSFAREMNIISNNGTSPIGCKLDWEDIETAIENETWYAPSPLDLNNTGVPKGTSVILRKLRGEKIKNTTLVRRKIARRFLVLNKESGFQVVVGKTPISSDDCPFYEKVEYMWYLGDDSKHYLNLFPNLIRDATKLKDRIEINGKAFKVRGWLGTVERPSDLLDDENNTIALFAHGKMIQENILREYQDGGNYAQYLVGNIEVDFLDSDDEPDIVTSDRQRVVQDDLRYEFVREFIHDCIKDIANSWSHWRLEKKSVLARENAIVKQWYDGLNKTNQRQASRVLGKLDKMDNVTEEQRLDLYQGAMSNFSSIKDVSASALKSIDETSFINLLKTENQKTQKPIETKFDTGVEKKAINGKDEKASSPPKTNVETNFVEIRKILAEFPVEDKLKDIALYDLEQAKKAYSGTAYKACVVMFGAILEGCMLGIIRREDVLNKIISDAQNAPKSLQRFGLLNPGLDRIALLQKIADELGFEDYKLIIHKLIPSIQNLRIGDIQVFRNTIHPWLAIKDPVLYGDIDQNRVSHLQTGLIMLLKNMAKWSP